MAGRDAGVVAWANNIRTTMAGDMARQIFADHIQNQVDYMDDYLNHILNGPTQNENSIIELVKTPSRNKVARKPHAQGSRLKSVLSFNLEDNGWDAPAPVNSFNKALLQAKGPDPVSAPNAGRPAGTVKRSSSGSSAGKSSACAAVPIHAYEPELDSDTPAQMEQDAAEEPANLSIIAEDDESADRSHISMGIPPRSVPKGEPIGEWLLPTANNRRPSSKTSPSAKPLARSTRRSTAPATPTQSEEESDVVRNDMSVDMDLDDSFVVPPINVALGSSLAQPQSPRPQETIGSPRIETTTAMDTYQDGFARVVDSPAANFDATSRTGQENHTAPLPHLSTEGSSHLQDVNDAMTAPLPTAVPARDPLTSHFPSFPPPIRQSTRLPKEGVTPGPPGGKRTSWLMKAREVKALDNAGMGSGMSIPPYGGNKRKSGDMFGATAGTGSSSTHDEDDEDRKHKMAKIFSPEEHVQKQASAPREGDREKENGSSVLRLVRQPSPEAPIVLPLQNFMPIRHADQEVPIIDYEDGVHFKRIDASATGSRFGQSMGKSFGGAIAIEIAEARAAAEAVLAQRDLAGGTPEISMLVDRSIAAKGESSMDASRRMSVSDLIPSSQGKSADLGNESTSTTPPDSPLPSRKASFAPPPPVSTQSVFSMAETKSVFSLPTGTSKVFSLPPSAMGLPVHLPAMAKKAPGVSAQSTIASMASEDIFDGNGGPAWMPSTQETGYSAFDSHPPASLEDDDSWPLHERIAAAEQRGWPSQDKEESMTWSTAPTTSQRVDNVTRTEHSTKDLTRSGETPSRVPGAFDMEIDGGFDDDGLEMDAEEAAAWGENELEEMETRELETAANRAVPRSDSQMSMASTSSTQSNIGLLGQAHKFVGNLLGTSKKGKPDSKAAVKSLNSAAAAAKKQQEQGERSATRAKEVKSIRELTNQRNAEKEKARLQEEDRKIKEERERRKREREEHTDKRPLKMPAKKVDEDQAKKRKLTVEPEKKPEVKRFIATKEKKDPAPPHAVPSRLVKLTTNASMSSIKAPVKSAMKAASSSPSLYNPPAPSGSSSKLVETKAAIKITATVSPAATTIKGKGKAKAAPVQDDDISQPAQVLQTQMAARAKARLQAAKVPMEPTSESIELPEIHSEYSDSEDEDRPRTFDPPNWAKSPELRQALQGQARINPDDIFGEIKPLRMEEVFKTRSAKFRARTSSANWTGTDRLTLEEQATYAKRMEYD